jgi:threonine/homoserine/homoserine lactone efflux protein
VLTAPQVLGYALASFILIVIPGPNVLFIVGRALAHGRRAALATVAGNAIGSFVVAACVTAGIGALVARSAPAFLALKLAGAGYLIWLGIQAFRRHGSLTEAVGPAEDAGSVRSGRAVRQGFLVGATNPKALILFGAVLPQFANRASGALPLQMLLLALLSIAIGLTSDAAWGLAAAAVRAWFARSPRRYRLVGGAGGLAMIGVGVTVALTGRAS